MTADPDFRLLFESAPGSYLVLAPDLSVVAVSDAYLRATLTKREELVGQPGLAALHYGSSESDASGAATLRASLESVLGEKRPHSTAIQTYCLPRAEPDAATSDVRVFKSTNSPVLDADGRVSYIIHELSELPSAVDGEPRTLDPDMRIDHLTMRGDRQLSQVLDAAPDAMLVVGADAKIRFANAQAETLFGQTRGALLETNVNYLLPPRFRVAHAEHLRSFFENPRARAMGSGLELFALRSDGTEVPIEVSLSPLLLEHDVFVTAAVRDITERKRIEAAARLTASRLAGAVESIHDAFALFDENDRLVLCNSAYRALMGSAVPGPLVGRSYEELLDAWLPSLEFIDEEQRRAFVAERRAQRRSSHADFSIRTRDGRSLRIIDRRTAEGGIVKTIWDLTEEAQVAEALKEARSAAEAASAAKSEFLSSMSHELRTPLNAILGFAQLLHRDKRQPLTERQLDSVRYILKGGEHLLKLIDDILDLSRIEAGRVPISLDAVDVMEVIREVYTTLRPQAVAAHIELELAVTAEALPLVTTDRTRFAQILMNFGSNALKYNRPGGHVTFSVHSVTNGLVRVSVSDTGLGIPVGKQSGLFQPFQRAGQENGPIEGTGIGLAISKRLAEMMRGSVGFRSEYGEGSEFWVDVPVESGRRNSSGPPANSGEFEARLETKPHTVMLYVEDNLANVRFMEELLRPYENIELIVATTAEEGVELARERRPKIIVLDINLPGMSGLDALRILRRRPETADTPIIAMSAAASEHDRRRGIQAGFSQYLTKPIRVDQFERVLADLLT